MSTVVWGIDVSTTRVAFGSTSGKTFSVEIPECEGPVRLARARDEALHGARAFTAIDTDPLCVWLEQPGSKHPNRPLLQMVGVVTEAIYASLSTLYAYPVMIYPIAVSSWKKASVGKGNATKEDVENWTRAMARKFDWDRYPANQDQADALAIAFAGRSMISEVAA